MDIILISYCFVGLKKTLKILLNINDPDESLLKTYSWTIASKIA